MATDATREKQVRSRSKQPDRDCDDGALPKGPRKTSVEDEQPKEDDYEKQDARGNAPTSGSPPG
jgi:hypothetical protein